MPGSLPMWQSGVSERSSANTRVYCWRGRMLQQFVASVPEQWSVVEKTSLLSLARGAVLRRSL